MKENEWFGQVRWCEDDLKVALEDRGYPVTEENIAKLYNICQSHWFTDCMIAAGWQFMYDQIDESNGFEKEE